MGKNKTNAKRALDTFKEEVATDMGLDSMGVKYKWPPKTKIDMNEPDYNTGNVGGEMVKRMIENAEKQMANRK